MEAILIFVYMAAGYWAAKRTIYANKILISNKAGGIFMQILIMGTILGWILIPVALIKTMLFRR